MLLARLAFLAVGCGLGLRVNVCAGTIASPCDQPSDIHCRYRHLAPNGWISSHNVLDNGSDEIYARQSSEISTVGPLIAPSNGAADKEKRPIAFGGAHFLSLWHDLSWDTCSSKEHDMRPGGPGAFGLDERYFDGSAGPICVGPRSNEFLETSRGVHYKLVQPFGGNLSSVCGGSSQLAVREVLGAGPDKQPILDRTHFASVVSDSGNTSVEFPVTDAAVRANNNFVLAYDTHSDRTPGTHDVKEEKEGRQVQYISGPQAPEDQWNEKYQADPVTKGAMVSTKATDIDVSYDGKHWFHLVGDFCVKHEK